MTWVAAGVMAAAGATKGAIDASKARKQARENDHFRRVAIAHSPWTDIGDPGADNVGNTSTSSAMLGGGMMGGSIGLMGAQGGLFGGGAGKAAAAAPAASSGAGAGSGVSFGSPSGSWGGTEAMGAQGGSAGSIGGLYGDVQRLQPKNPYATNQMFGINPNQVG